MIITRVLCDSSQLCALICADSDYVYHWKQLEWQNWLLFAAFIMTKVSVFLIKQTTCLFSDVTPDRQGDRPRRYNNIDRSVVFYGCTAYWTCHYRAYKTSSFWNGPVSIKKSFIYILLHISKAVLWSTIFKLAIRSEFLALLFLAINY